MKLYHFTANDYGHSWFVCAKSREKAIKAVRESIEKDYQNEKILRWDKYDRTNWTEAQKTQEKEEIESDASSSRAYSLKDLEDSINNRAPYKGGEKASIEEYKPGHVIFSEVS